MVTELVSTPAFPWSLPGKLASTASSISSNATGSKEQIQFSCVQVLRSGSPTLTPPGPTLLFCSGEMQDRISQLLYVLYKSGGGMEDMGTICSPASTLSGLAHLHADKRVSSTVLPRQGTGPAFLLVAACEGHS